MPQQVGVAARQLTGVWIQGWVVLELCRKPFGVGRLHTNVTPGISHHELCIAAVHGDCIWGYITNE